MALDFVLYNEQEYPIKQLPYYLDLWEEIWPLAKENGLEFFGGMDEYWGPEADRVVPIEQFYAVEEEIRLLKDVFKQNLLIVQFLDDVIDFMREARNLNSTVYMVAD